MSPHLSGNTQFPHRLAPVLAAAVLGQVAAVGQLLASSVLLAQAPQVAQPQRLCAYMYRAYMYAYGWLVDWHFAPVCKMI